ncbi:MAG TPA: hypothetical protein VNO86_02270 [Candidatus Binatia bacterium]|nr:hypothetical protein [Candidatus Binatia bacterium]
MAVANHPDDPRWEPGMPILDRQAVPERSGPQVLPRAVPETRPTPLAPHYISLSVVVLGCGVVAITALNAGFGFGDPIVKLCILVGAPILLATTADAMLRIWRSAWAWMPVDRGRGWFRLAWLVPAAIGFVAAAWAAVLALTA